MSDALPPFFRLAAFDTLASTSDEAKRRAREGAPEGTLVTARTQTAGHGRQGRRWVSVPGNLYASLVLRPDAPAARAAQLGFAASLAIGEAIRRFAPQAVLAFKWPNDVLLGGRKTAGILLESEGDPAGKVRFVVLGVGVNLVAHPAYTEFPATSLQAATAETVTPEAFLAALAPALLLWYERWRDEGFAALRQAWLERAAGIGQDLRARLPGETLTGRFAGLDDDGMLLLDGPAGRRRIAAGDVFPAVAEGR
ncbi:MAG: biotin--[acetyl-CoA-carboxylase] ligase [Alphaproteobacteria bacterium]|nr:biotin--[acetyl-CoA-carboxylase] ligase [Alphaproteobacteria bacterium]